MCVQKREEETEHETTSVFCDHNTEMVYTLFFMQQHTLSLLEI